MKLEFSPQIFENTVISNTDRRADIDSCFRNFANAPKNLLWLLSSLNVIVAFSHKGAYEVCWTSTFMLAS
jgi:hypothetical protein